MKIAKVFTFALTVILTIIVPLMLTAFFPLQDPPVCPADRILVKTLTDSATKDVNFFPHRSDVQEILKIAPPAKLTPHMERTGKEFSTYQVNCYVKSYTLTENGDYRLSIQGFDDSSAVAIAQIINPNCEQAKKSKYSQEFQTCYETFGQYALLNHKASKGVYKIVGPILFDTDQKRQIVATIHPVTYISKFK